ncbi:MAG: hypothetical protein ACP5I7_06145 [Sulfolobales archaeon]
MGALIVVSRDTSKSSEEVLIDTHFIVSRIINRYIALQGDPVFERHVLPWLQVFRDSLWRFCEKPSGLCSVDKFNDALEIFVKSYRDFLYNTGAPIEIKEKIYFYVKEIIDQVIEFIRKNYPNYSPSVSIDKPDKYRVELNMKNIKDQDLRKMILEIQGSEGVVSKYELKRSREILELPVGTYQIRVISGDKEIYRDVLRVHRDSSLSIDLSKDISKRHELSPRQIIYAGKEAAVQIPRKKYSASKIKIKRLINYLAHVDVIALILLMILLIIDLLIIFLK